MDYYLGEIRMFAGAKPPADWLICDGSLLQIAQHQPLYALIGTIYGGDGSNTFALPDLRGRLAMGTGSGPTLTPRALAQATGAESVTVTVANIPVHTHGVMATTLAATQMAPASNATFADLSPNTGYIDTAASPAGSFSSVDMGNAAVTPSAGGGLPHENRMPSLPITFIIATNGLFPTPA